jgi:peptidoglycan/LPS O-acetylase OafA/YrhL
MVVLSHLSRNLPVNPPGDIELSLLRQLALVANGQAAVGLFFVISGFCIHFGQSRNLTVDAGPFLLRRTVRIGAPLLAVSALAAYLGPWASAALKTVLWSLYCELAYYFAYPVLLACRRWWSMMTLIAIAGCASAILVVVHLSHASFGDNLLATAIMCYPAWVAGAWLAERYDAERPRSKVPVIMWRAAALSLCWLTGQGHPGPLQISAPALLAVVALFSAGYLPSELARWREIGPPAWAEKLGRGSYTLYLVHILPVAYFLQVPASISFWPMVAIEIVVISGLTFAAYWLFEAPAHRLARSLGRGTFNLKTARSEPA